MSFELDFTSFDTNFNADELNTSFDTDEPDFTPLDTEEPDFTSFDADEPGLTSFDADADDDVEGREEDGVPLLLGFWPLVGVLSCFALREWRGREGGREGRRERERRRGRERAVVVDEGTFHKSGDKQHMQKGFESCLQPHGKKQQQLYIRVKEVTHSWSTKLE